MMELFFTFVKIGLFTFGGGYAMISMIENNCVVQITLNRNASSAIAERLFHFYRYEVPLD